jgi:hypothetical protein
MKKQLTTVLIIAIFFPFIGYNQTYTIRIPYSIVAATSTSSESISKTLRDKLGNGDPSVNVIVELTGGLPAPGSAVPLKVNGGLVANISTSTYTIDVTAEIIAAIQAKKENHQLEVQNAANIGLNKILVKWDKFITEKEASKLTLEHQNQILQIVRNNASFNEPYKNRKNRVNLFFDEKGKLLNFLPVNVDANDYFYMYVICPTGQENNYRINTIEGDYAPVDLQIRPSVKPITLANSAENGKEYEPIEYKIVELRAGPFTTENFKFNLVYDSTNGKAFNGPVYSTRINKLYHVGVGVSVVYTTLENPDFRVVALPTGSNTIERYNTGGRTLLTFNVIWYWSVLQQKPKGSVITSGRDILKDEPTFSFQRIYPTIGVNLDKKLNENIFAGFVYEFARGGSLIAGVHYGKVKEISDKNFVLSETPFTGTDKEIKLTNIYKPAFFFGVNLDTRIFNTLFGRGE